MNHVTDKEKIIDTLSQQIRKIKRNECNGKLIHSTLACFYIHQTKWNGNNSLIQSYQQ